MINIWTYKLRKDEDWTFGARNELHSTMYFYEFLIEKKWQNLIQQALDIGQTPIFQIAFKRANGTRGALVIDNYTFGENTSGANLQLWTNLVMYSGVKSIVDYASELLLIIKS